MKNLNILKSTYLFSILIMAILMLSQNGYSQCASDDHSTNPNDATLSCTEAANPNPVRGNTHWLLYDFGYVYKLGQTHFWNYNVAGATDKGYRNIIIDYSMNGTNWTELGNYEIPEASGNSGYSGVDGPDFEGITARYVLITATSNWGDNDCFGIAELRIDVEEGSISVNEVDESSLISVQPNPVADVLQYDVGDLPIEHMSIISAEGRLYVKNNVTSSKEFVDVKSLPAGAYFINFFRKDGPVITKKLVKVDKD